MTRPSIFDVLRLAALPAVLLLAPPALAATTPDAAVAPAFGNTVLSIYPDGRSQKIWIKPDGSWNGLSRRGNPLAGTWRVKQDQVCVKQSQPPTLPVAFCMPFPSDPHVGSTWPAKDMLGTPIHLTIVKGKVTS